MPVTVLACTLMLFSSCKKEDPVVPEDKTPVTPTPSEIPNSFFAEVDGDDFYPVTLSATKSPDKTKLGISAPGSTMGSFGFIMPIDIGVGTYTFDDPMLGPKTATFLLDQQNQYGAQAGTGTLKVIFHDKVEDVIRCSFEYTATPLPTSSATDFHNITNGTFTINY
jgi:hypothetical protein